MIHIQRRLCIFLYSMWVQEMGVVFMPRAVKYEAVALLRKNIEKVVITRKGEIFDKLGDIRHEVKASSKREGRQQGQQ